MKIEIETKNASNLADMLHYIAKLAGIGHSFSVVVDPKDSEYRRSYDVDGDGPACIVSVRVDGRVISRLGASSQEPPVKTGLRDWLRRYDENIPVELDELRELLAEDEAPDCSDCEPVHQEICDGPTPECQPEEELPARDCPACRSGRTKVAWEKTGSNVEYLKCSECGHEWSIRWGVVERRTLRPAEETPADKDTEKGSLKDRIGAARNKH
jgi:Zn ribbon nucleic-acid-binding protein